jgi:hypothetical protein
MDLIRKDTYESATSLSLTEGSQGLVLYVKHDLEDLIRSPKDREVLSRGWQIACPDVEA